PLVTNSDWRRRIPRTQEEAHASLTFFQVLNRVLTEAGSRRGEEGLVALFNRIGIGPNRVFDPAALDDATKDALLPAVEDGWALVKARSAALYNNVVNGWGTMGSDAAVGAWGFDTLQR